MVRSLLVEKKSLETPKTQYADCNGIGIAYQVFGQGAQDLVYVPGTISNIEMAWDDSRQAAFFRELAEFYRVILFDKRGQGVSDPIHGAPTFEERMDDVRAVMEAANSNSATLFGTSEGGPMCALFAATYPDKVDGLILYGSMAKFTGTDDYPYMPDSENLLNYIPSIWGTHDAVKLFAPDLMDDQDAVAETMRFMRQVGSPNAIRQIYEATAKMDVRSVLPLISVPTLILHRRHEYAVQHHNGRYLADNILNSVYLELPGRNHVPWVGDQQSVIQAMVQFSKSSGGTTTDGQLKKPHLATVLFTDIVNSTAMLADIGDDNWRRKLNQHDKVAFEQVASFGGRLVKNTGDGILALFDKPSRAIKCATALTDQLQDIDIPIRAGLHAGEIKMRGEDVTGIVIHIAARVMEHAKGNEVLITQVVANLTADQEFTVKPRGNQKFKGISEEIEILVVE
jgi:class 3 adenylate cyclase